MASWKAELKRQAKKYHRMQMEMDEAAKKAEPTVAPKPVRTYYGAGSQEELILAFFEDNPQLYLTPDEVLKEVFYSYEERPLTSIRRAMTNLTKAGYLEKTPVYAMGPYLRKVHTWRLRCL